MLVIAYLFDMYVAFFSAAKHILLYGDYVIQVNSNSSRLSVACSGFEYSRMYFGTVIVNSHEKHRIKFRSLHACSLRSIKFRGVYGRLIIHLRSLRRADVR
jgi:hypothetical protein